jgi:hypothetical protein
MMRIHVGARPILAVASRGDEPDPGQGGDAPRLRAEPAHQSRDGRLPRRAVRAPGAIPQHAPPQARPCNLDLTHTHDKQGEKRQ